MANSIVDVLNRRKEMAERMERHEKWHPTPEDLTCPHCGFKPPALRKDCDKPDGGYRTVILAAKTVRQVHDLVYTVDGVQICGLPRAEQLRVWRG